MEEFKLSFDKHMELYNQTILPKILNFEKSFVLNNCVPHIESNQIDDFCEKSNKLENFTHPWYNERHIGGYIMNHMINLEKENYVINSLAIKINCGLSDLANLILYFDSDYKNAIVKFDTDYNSFMKSFEKSFDNFTPGIKVIIYTNYNFAIEYNVSNYKMNIIQSSNGRNDLIVKLLENVLYGNHPKTHGNFKLINLDTTETTEYVSLDKPDKLKKNLIEQFLTGVQKIYHPKIILDYLRNQSNDAIREFFNECGNYNKFAYESVMEDSQKEKIKYENQIDKLKKILTNHEKALVDKNNENNHYIGEVNKLKKELVILNKKYVGLEKLYENLLEKDV
jgi:hypothetical protein